MAQLACICWLLLFHMRELCFDIINCIHVYGTMIILEKFKKLEKQYTCNYYIRKRLVEIVATNLSCW